MRRATMMWRLIAISALPLALVGFDVGLVSAAIRGMRIELELKAIVQVVAQLLQLIERVDRAGTI